MELLPNKTKHPEDYRKGEPAVDADQPFVFGPYTGPDEIPVASAWPLDEELWEPLVDSEEPVTFLAVVPLDTLVRGEDAILTYCAEAFNNQVDLRNAEFRAIGTASENESFSDQFVGDIPLQVTCTLQSFEA